MIWDEIFSEGPKGQIYFLCLGMHISLIFLQVCNLKTRKKLDNPSKYISTQCALHVHRHHFYAT